MTEPAVAATPSTRLHLGCGHEILPGFVNVDSAALPGVDVVHDLRRMPWPFADGAASEIVIKHVLEHLPNTIEVMEEIWRVCADGAEVTIRVPFWNSSDFVSDPTHVKAFNENTFDFFDPRSPACQTRPYYSRARFHVMRKQYWFTVVGRSYPLTWTFLTFLLRFLALHFCNVIRVMEVRLRAVK